MNRPVHWSMDDKYVWHARDPGCTVAQCGAMCWYTRKKPPPITEKMCEWCRAWFADMLLKGKI